MYQLLDKLIPYKILAIYRTGSFIYGLDTDKSDEDYIAIVDDFKEASVVKADGVDFFVFGIPYFEKLINFDDSVLSYFAIWTDNTLLAQKNLVYIDETFKTKFNELINVDWEKHFYTWLKRVIDYFSIRIDVGVKECYHLFRIKSQVAYYLKTGKFEYYFDEEDRKNALAYKANPQQFLHQMLETFTYLESVYNEGTS